MVKKLNVFIFFMFNAAVLAAGGFYGYNDLQNRKVLGDDIQTKDSKTPIIVDEEKMSKIAIRDFEPGTAVLGKEVESDQSPVEEISEDPNRDIFNSGQQDGEDNKKNEFSFVVIGDSESYGQKGYNEGLLSVMAKAKGQDLNLVFFAGDLISLSAPTVEENQKKLEGLLSSVGNYFEKYYIAFGDKDIECGADCINLWQKLFFKKESSPEAKTMLYHSFDFQGTHFAILSSSYPLENKIDDIQLDWLDKDLSATAKTNRIVLVHVPPVTFFQKSASTCHDMSCDLAAKEKLNQILAKNKVDLVISGHESVFDHKIEGGIDYVLAGNSGNKPKYDGVIKDDIFSVFSVKNAEINLKAMKVSGEVVREINIK